jgi:hypothetical protein
MVAMLRENPVGLLLRNQENRVQRDDSSYYEGGNPREKTAT